MKLKCPGCANLLTVPDSAAGKVVKCPCGKQLRAPGGSQTAASAAAKPGPGSTASSATRAAARPAVTQQAAAHRSAGGLDDGMFDELTDGDLKPVLAVARPGVPAAKLAATSSNKLMQQYGPTESKARSAKGQRSTGKTVGAVACFIFFILFSGIATKNVFFGGPNRPDETAGLVAYAMGAYLIPVVLFIGGLILLRKPRLS